MAGVAAVVASVRQLWRSVDGLSAADYYLVYVNAQIADCGDVADLYSEETQHVIGEEFFQRALVSGSRLYHENASMRRSLDSRGSPFLYASLGWMGTKYDNALRTHRLLLLVAFCVAVPLLGWYCGIPVEFSLFLLAALLRWFFPFLADMLVGNVNALQLLLLVIIVRTLDRDPVVSGALLGMMLAAKPTIVTVIAVLFLARVIQKDFRRLTRELIGGAAGITAAVMIGSLFFHRATIWRQWLKSAGGVWQTLYLREWNNVTPIFPLVQKYGTWTSYVAAAVLMAIVCVAIRKTKRCDDVLLISAGILIYLISATLVWLHYLVLAIVPAIALMRRRTTAPIGIAALAMMAPAPPPLRATQIGAALFLLYGGVVWTLWRERVRVPATMNVPQGAALPT